MSIEDVLLLHLQGLSEHERFYARLVTEGPSLAAHARTTLIGIQSALSTHLSVAFEREAAAGSVRRMPLSLLFNTWLGLVNHYVCNRDLFAPDSRTITRCPTARSRTVSAAPERVVS